VIFKELNDYHGSCYTIVLKYPFSLFAPSLKKGLQKYNLIMVLPTQWVQGVRANASKTTLIFSNLFL